MQVHFNQALQDLKKMLFDLSGQAEHAVNLAVNAVAFINVDTAANVIHNDVAIDAAEIKIEEECLKILALYQPVAGDLREVVTILKINNELERVGDLAANIAERVEDMELFIDRGVVKFDFGVMVEKGCAMLKQALDAFAYHDAALAEKVILADNAVDALHRHTYEWVRDGMLKNSQNAQYYLDCLTISRCLERIADIATNIGEDIIYLETGRIVRHQHEGIQHGK